MEEKKVIAAFFGFYLLNKWESVYKSYQSALVGIEKYSADDAKLEIIAQTTHDYFNGHRDIPTFGLWVCPWGLNTKIKERPNTIKAFVEREWFENKELTKIIEALTDAYILATGRYPI